MKVKLTFTERAHLTSYIPVESDRMTMRIARELREELSFSMEEIKKYNITFSTDSTGKTRAFWNPDANSVVKEIEVVPVMEDKIFEKLEAIEKKQKTTDLDVTLWDKFEFEKRKLKAVKKE